MKNLLQKIKKIAPLVLAGAGILGCATYPPEKPPIFPINQNPIVSQNKTNYWVDLKNGFSAESYKVHDNVLLLTEVYLGESFFIKTEEGYEGVKTSKYHTTPTEVFDTTYDEFCRAIDNGGDKFLTEMETLFFIDRVYKSLYEVQWVEEE